MPIDYRIDRSRKLVVCRITGVLTDEEIFRYQQEVTGVPEYAAFNEYVDVSGAERFALPSASRVRELAWFAAAADQPGKPTKMAIFAPSDVAFGLGRMYQTHRQAVAGSTKQVGVFRTMAEALEFVGLDEDPWSKPQE